MKENKYDDDKFFLKYSQMNRSKEGLIAAGEWETLKKMLPNFFGKRLLDLGCGYGWHCIYAIENGATSAVGVDISYKMLEVAKDKTNSDAVEYICMAIEDIDFPLESFNIVLSSLAFHYIENFQSVASKVYQILKPQGNFIFSVEHPIFTAYGTQDWAYDVKGNIMHFPVDNYFYEGERKATFLGETVTKYHKTLTKYLNSLINVGFKITAIVEPQPGADMMATIPDMVNEMRRPMMLIIAAEK